MTTHDLGTAVARTGHERYRWLTSDANPDAFRREGYRRIVREIAAGPWPPPPKPAAYPPLLEQLGNAARSAVAFAASGGKLLDADAVEGRRAVCRSCEHFDVPVSRCRLCGCWTEAKTTMAALYCPLGKWANGPEPS